MSKQNVLTLEFDVSKVSSINFFRKKMCELFYISNSSISGDILNEYMRDLAWIDENYVVVNFLNINKVKTIDLSNKIHQHLHCWQNYWDNCDVYEDYKQRHPYGKTVIILF